MDLEAYLEAHGVTLQQVYQTLADAVDVRPGEVVFLSGSLLAGFGNVHSDIDAFIVTSRELPRSTVGDIVMLPLQDTHIDLERWMPATVESLFGRVEAAAGHTGGRDPRPAMMFTGRELEFLYRLRIGRPLTAESHFAALVKRFRPELVAGVLFDRARVLAAAVQTDIAGFLHDGDDGSAFLSARHLVDVVAGAFLASQGEINPGPKWRYRLLQALGSRPETLELPPHLDGPRMIDIFLRFWTGALLENGLADYARQAVMLLNLIMPWCQRRLTTYDVMEESRAGIALVGPGPFEARPAPLTDRAPDMPLGQLRTTARVAWDGNEVRLHLPGEGYAFGIGRVTHLALAYFDGRTTAREGAHGLADVYGGPEEPLLQALLDLRAVLLNCGYLDPAPRTSPIGAGRIRSHDVHRAGRDRRFR